MNKNAKTIGNSLRPQIEITKSYMRCSTRPIWGDGYVFKKALSEIRKEGIVMSLNKTTGDYLRKVN